MVDLAGAEQVLLVVQLTVHAPADDEDRRGAEHGEQLQKTGVEPAVVPLWQLAGKRNHEAEAHGQCRVAVDERLELIAARRRSAVLDQQLDPEHQSGAEDETGDQRHPG